VARQGIDAKLPGRQVFDGREADPGGLSRENSSRVGQPAPDLGSLADQVHDFTLNNFLVRCAQAPGAHSIF
jgi:hypothetical protein